MRLHVLVGLVILGGAAAVAACGGETDTQYGPPGGLVGKTPPPPDQGVGGSSSGGSGSTSSSSSSSSGSSSSGGTGSSSGGSSSGSSSGGSGGDAGGSSSGGSSGSSSGTCGVSWANQVFTTMQTDGQCGSSTSCHAQGGNSPTFLNGNAAGTYNSFAQYTLLENKPYIKAGDTNLGDSTIDCSLDTQTCYTLVPMPSAASAPNWSANDKTLIRTWVQCGAPNN